MADDTCEDCGAGDVRVHLSDTPLYDGCADRRVARLTGLPELGAPPAPFVLTGPDGKRHRMQPRPWRAPTGIVVELEEVGVPVGEGFQFSILGPHEAEVGYLLRHLRAHAEAEVARQLESDPHRARWVLAGDEVAGRLAWGEGREMGAPYDVVVDGRTFSWEDLGHALSSYEGWRFRLVMEDRSLAARDLPKAERLSRLLFDQAQRGAKDYRDVADDDIVEDYLTIERVEPGALWLSGDVGPLKVSTEASSLTRPGWSVYLVLARSGHGWKLLESGNVYP